MVNGSLPEGWGWTTIGEIAYINSRDIAIRDLPDDLLITFVPMAAVDGDQGIIARPEERSLKEVRKGFKPFSDGDVIFAKITPCMENGKVAIAQKLKNGRGFGSTEFHVLRPREIATAKWLYHFIRQESFRTDAKAHFAGTAGQLRVPPSVLVDYSIPLPPLLEQERIVAKIEELFTQLDAGVASLKRVKVALKRYKASLLKTACEGRLVPQDPRDEPAEELLRRLGKTPLEGEGLPELPEGWRWTRAGDIGEISGGITKNSKRIALPKKFSYLRVANVYANELRLGDISEIGVEENEITRVLLRKGDLLVVEGNGSADQIGRVAIWDGSISPCLHQNHIIKVRFQLTEIVKYILYWLLSDGGREQIRRV